MTTAETFMEQAERARDTIVSAICKTECHENGIAFEQIIFGKDVDAMVSNILLDLNTAGFALVRREQDLSLAAAFLRAKADLAEDVSDD